MDIDAYIQLIKDLFPFLFSDYGFVISYKLAYRPDQDWYAVGLESAANRVLFVREQGGGSMAIGHCASPFGNNPTIGGQWFQAMSLLGFLLQKEWDWSFLKDLPLKDLPRSSMAFSAKEMRPYFGKMLEMVRSPEAISKWKPEFDRYLEESVKKRFPNYKQQGKES